MNFSHYMLFFLVSVPAFLSSTAKYLNIIKGPKGQLLFVIAERHDMANAPKGRDKEVIEKLLAILKEAEEKPHTGFHLLIESSAKEKEHFRTPFDLLRELISYKDEFKNSTMEDIEVRKISAAAIHIFGQITPQIIEQYFRGERSLEEDAERIRKAYKNLYTCDMDTFTFSDIYDEFENQIACMEKIIAKKSDIVKHRLQCRIKAIKQYIVELKEILARYEVEEDHSVLDTALRLWERHNYEPDIREHILRAILNVSSQIFNVYLLEKLLKMLGDDYQKPIILIAGGSHTTSVLSTLDLFSYKRVECAIKFTSPPAKKQVLPLEPKALDLLKKKADDFPPVYEPMCILL